MRPLDALDAAIMLFERECDADRELLTRPMLRNKLRVRHFADQSLAGHTEVLEALRALRASLTR